jgi:hypothetical protein
MVLAEVETCIGDNLRRNIVCTEDRRPARRGGEMCKRHGQFKRGLYRAQHYSVRYRSQASLAFVGVLGAFVLIELLLEIRLGVYGLAKRCHGGVLRAVGNCGPLPKLRCFSLAHGLHVAIHRLCQLRINLVRNRHNIG